MKKDYYKVLNLSDGAGNDEVKRAYFQLVRQYSPEDDPERFQEIREAYEALQKQGSRQRYQPETPKDKFAIRMLQQIVHHEEARDYRAAGEVCKEALKYYPDEIAFLYKLAVNTRNAGNTGKTVTHFQALVDKEPNNRHFIEELATACFNRGYYKKAFPYFTKAYDMGCRDMEFLLCYSLNCDQNERYREGREVLAAMLRERKRASQEDMVAYFEAFIGAFKMDSCCKKSIVGELLDLLEAFLQENAIYIKNHLESLFMVLSFVCSFHIVTIGSNIARVKRILQFIMVRCASDDHYYGVFSELHAYLDVFVIRNDERLGKVVKEGAEVFVRPDYEDEYVERFYQIDSKLCHLNAMPEVLGELAIVEKDYPDYFEKIKEFVRVLREGRNLPYQKERLLKDYLRMKKYMDYSLFEELYPSEARQLDEEVFVSSEETYVRGAKKVGRNDPCPCGSGKKFKRCCWP